MPIYDFKCTECEKTFELHCNYNKRNKMRCKCGGKLKMIFTTKVGMIGSNSSLSWRKELDGDEDCRQAMKGMRARGEETTESDEDLYKYNLVPRGVKY